MFRPKARMLRILLALICIAAGGLSLYVTVYALLLTLNSRGNAYHADLPQKIGHGVGVLLGVLLMIGVVVFFFGAAYRLLKTTKPSTDENVAGRGSMTFRTLWGIGCFFISAVCAFVAVLNMVTIHNGSMRVSFPTKGTAAMMLFFFIVATFFFLWRGIRWMRYPKKDKGPIDFLGEKF